MKIDNTLFLREYSTVSDNMMKFTVGATTTRLEILKEIVMSELAESSKDKDYILLPTNILKIILGIDGGSENE